MPGHRCFVCFGIGFLSQSFAFQTIAVVRFQLLLPGREHFEWSIEIQHAAGSDLFAELTDARRHAVKHSTQAFDFRSGIAPLSLQLADFLNRLPPIECSFDLDRFVHAERRQQAAPFLAMFVDRLLRRTVALTQNAQPTASRRRSFLTAIQTLQISNVPRAFTHAFHQVSRRGAFGIGLYQMLTGDSLGLNASNAILNAAQPLFGLPRFVVEVIQLNPGFAVEKVPHPVTNTPPHHAGKRKRSRRQGASERSVSGGSQAIGDHPKEKQGYCHRRDSHDRSIHPRWNGFMRIHATHHLAHSLDFESQLLALETQASEVFKLRESLLFADNRIGNGLDVEGQHVAVELDEFFGTLARQAAIPFAKLGAPLQCVLIAASRLQQTMVSGRSRVD